MGFKSYDGWTAVTNEGGKAAVLAKFTKDDDSIVHYNYAALRRRHKRPPEHYTQEDSAKIAKACKEGPEFFSRYLGWQDIGRGKRSIHVCHFSKASGEKITRGLSALQNMAANPPPKFSPYDKTMLELAITEAPGARL